MGSFGLGHWIVVLIIVLLIFGTKRLTSGARDVGKAVNEFKKGMSGEDDPPRGLNDDSRRNEDASQARREDERNPR